MNLRWHKENKDLRYRTVWIGVSISPTGAWECFGRGDSNQNESDEILSRRLRSGDVMSDHPGSRMVFVTASVPIPEATPFVTKGEVFE